MNEDLLEGRTLGSRRFERLMTCEMRRNEEFRQIVFVAKAILKSIYKKTRTVMSR